ncbi:MAG: succinate dehydrogenase, cytochrome b556 subunit [Thiohalobacteraceae bacterium]
MSRAAPRPRFLNLLLIRMPVGALTSLGHRVSGILLFLALPLAAFLLDLSLQGPEGFERAGQLLRSPLLRAVEILFVWSLVHHLLAGIRFLLIDIDIGVEKMPARHSALLVNLAAPVLTALLLWWFW